MKCKEINRCCQKGLQLINKEFTMYRSKDRKTGQMFEELFPFGGKLDNKNRWLRISSIIPWEELESSYCSHFSEIGRPALDGRLVIGLLLLKHMSGLSDREVVLELLENPYWQAFCGYEHFKTTFMLEASSLSKLRKRLGAKYFKELEEKTYRVLIEKKIIKAKGMLVDATVFPEYIKYPNDVELLNDAREWLVKQVKNFGEFVGKKYRTYCRKADKIYMQFSKKRKKTKKEIQKSKKQMLQYVRRNIDQLEDVLKKVKNSGYEIIQNVQDKLKVAKKIYSQQLEMYKTKTYRVKDRIVSFHKPYVRPIKRGKSGKKVEFGPKSALTHVDGFLILDTISHDNFSEASTETVKNQIQNYEKCFNKKPDSFTGDNIYGTAENRALLDNMGIRAAFKSLGRKNKNETCKKRWYKKKHKERNRIEGNFGTGKEHYGLNHIKYNGIDGSEMWIRGGILAMNLKTALKRI
jgi:IS5 family transposase